MTHRSLPSHLQLALALALVALTAGVAGAEAPLDAAQMKALLEVVDDRQRNTGDYKALCFIEQKEKDKNDLVYEAVLYRRDVDDKFMMLFVGPRKEAGKGYLQIDDNLWFFDPSVGKWERRTERERIGGTDSRRADFDPPAMATEFEHTYIGREKLGRFAVHHLQLDAKKDADVPYPRVDVWIDIASGNVLKQQERALSGRLMRTTYNPKWERIRSESKQADVYYPREIRIFDEVEKANRTTVLIQKVDLQDLPKNIFTKAWLEGQSR
jgi:hypothetical protein